MMFEHRSVLLEETVASLNIKPDGIYVLWRCAGIWGKADV